MKPPRLWILSSKKTILYTDIPGISRMMKGYSSRAVSDRMDAGFIEKNIDPPPLLLKLLNGQAALIFDLAKMGTGLNVFPLL
jgi:hypothetical protein